VLSGETERGASLLVANPDVPLLGVLLAQLDHALEQLDRSIGNRSRKRGAPRLVLLVELVDHLLGRARLDARAHSESFQSVGGSTEADEAGEVAVFVGDGELAHEGHGSGAVVGLEGEAQWSGAVVGGW